MMGELKKVWREAASVLANSGIIGNRGNQTLRETPLNGSNYDLLKYLNKEARLRVSFLFSRLGEIHTKPWLSGRVLMFALAHH